MRFSVSIQFSFVWYAKTTAPSTTTSRSLILGGPAGVGSKLRVYTSVGTAVVMYAGLQRRILTVVPALSGGGSPALPG